MSEQSVETEPNNVIHLDVVSDVVCPWCLVGKVNLENALAQMSDLPIEVRWRPFQLNPTMPKEGMDRREYLIEKFGGDHKSNDMYKRLVEIGEEMGIHFDFDAIERMPNTFNAHRLIHWASSAPQNSQTELVNRLFEVFFKEGGNIGETEKLVEVARELGMDGELVEELLATERDNDVVQSEMDVAVKMGITGVPCFIIDNKYAVMGAQPPEAIVEAVRQAAEDKTFTDNIASG